eukprot:scaffold36823_cov58-Phaeocystis_antarctica.AAC.5
MLSPAPRSPPERLRAVAARGEIASASREPLARAAPWKRVWSPSTTAAAPAAAAAPATEADGAAALARRSCEQTRGFRRFRTSNDVR